MKVTREQAVRNRERIVETAAQRFRERGFEGIGVADLMKEAGLTHGGFYGHFSSKEDLIAEASDRALMGSLALFTKVAERAPADPLPAIASAYLTSRHRDKPGESVDVHTVQDVEWVAASLTRCCPTPDTAATTWS